MNFEPQLRMTAWLRERRSMTLVLVAVAYFLAARLGLSLAFATKQVTAVWPPTGIAITALLLFGGRVWPALFVGALLANVGAHESVLTAAGIAAGNTAGPVLGTWLLRRFGGVRSDLTRAKDVFALILFGSTLSMIITATNGVAQLAIGGIIPWTAYWSVWWVWWVGDAMGVLLVSPCLLTLFSAAAATSHRWFERALALSGAVAVACLAFSAGGLFADNAGNYHLQYAVFPFIIWTALRFGPRETSQVVLVVSGIAVWATTHDRGPFGASTLALDERLALLEMFMAVAAVTGLALAAVTAERSRAEAALREANDARFRTLFAESPLSLWEEDFSDVRAYLDQLRNSGVEHLAAHFRKHPDSVLEAARRVRVLAVNQATLDLYEATSEEQFLRQLPATFGPEALATFADELCALSAGRTHFRAETMTVTPAGRKNVISVRVNVIPGYEQTWARLAVSIYDLTAHKDNERRLRESLREKEVLLSEVHHRVKNNLQVVSSLLNLQESNLEEPLARRALAEARSRIQSIALVHEKLYQSPNLSHVAFGDYTAELLRTLDHAQGGATRGISIQLRADAVELSTDAAITSGLMLNELVTNALKYAFPDGRRGSVIVEILCATPYNVEIAVSDDGIGLASTVDLKEPSSVGLSLVVALAQQLDATLAVERKNGTRFRIAFGIDPSSSQRPPSSRFKDSVAYQ